MKKSKQIILIIFIILCMGVASYGTYLLTATQVSYTKDGNTVTVEAALNDLYSIVKNSSQSTLPSIEVNSEETSPYLPTGCTVTNSNLATGLTIKDANNNEWTWVEVPKSVTAEVDDSLRIEIALREYCSDVISAGGSDYKTTTMGWNDNWYDGCGLTNNEYYDYKCKMLNSIKKYGGFYIGKYEVGYTSGSIRGSHTATSNNSAVIQQNAYPYNFVYCSEAEDLCEGLNPDSSNTTTSLLFGIQRDLVLKYLKEKGGLTLNQLRSDSTDWGNYINSSFVLNRGKYAKYNAYGTWYDYTTANSSFVTVNNGTSTKVGTTQAYSILLTTGAADRNAKLNIYDLAGNVWEWTLEHATSDSSYQCAYRGGGFIASSSSYPASYRHHYSTTDSYSYIGFRTTLYSNS